MKKIILLSTFLCFLSFRMLADVVGSDTAVGIFPSYTFPSSCATPNRVAAFALMQGGFVLQDSNTTLEFDSAFPVYGPLYLNGGTLKLHRDLILQHPASLSNLGQIIGNNRIFSLCKNVTSIPDSNPVFQETVLELNGDVTLLGKTTFKGACTIEGNGYQLILGTHGKIKVGGQLTMHNVTIVGINNQNVQCNSDAAQLILDDVTWIQSDNYSFYSGSFVCNNNVIFRGNGLFDYQSSQVSTISSNARLVLDQGFTFFYDPIRLASPSLLAFEDQSAELVLNGATLQATAVGLQLINGSMTVLSDSYLFGPATATGVTLGNGNVFNDFAVHIFAGANLSVPQGSLNYYNVAAASWAMDNSLSMLTMGTLTILRLYNNMNLGSGQAYFYNNATIARVVTAQILGSVTAESNLYFVQL